MKLEGVSLKQASVDVTKIDNYVKDTVNKVKQHYQLRPELESAASGPQGTVPRKTQVSVPLL